MKETWVLTRKGADFSSIAKEFSVHPVIARLIRNRNVIGEEAIQSYLYGKVEELYSPWLLRDMEQAVDLLQEGKRTNKKIRIIGDYDIDGVCATYLLKQGLSMAGIKADSDIPDRIRDGYGINRQLIDRAAAEGVEMIVTCDNGISALEEIAYAKELGMTVIVTDHHEVPYTETEEGVRYHLPPADAVIDPKRNDCSYPFSGLCGAMVAWKLMDALFDREGIDPEKEKRRQLLLFGAIATVGDVMDLVDENRIVVKYGLGLFQSTTHPGLRALMEVNHLRPGEITAYHIGFVLGPCLNASGRLDTAKRALALLEAKEQADAIRLAEDLKALNDSRKTLTEQALSEAVRMVETTDLRNDKVLVVYLPDCHESIAGILAGRLRERYHKPAFVITKGEESLKGSGRSIEAYSMFERLQECKPYLLHFGGHPMAAGLSLEENNLEPFRQAINEACALTEEDFAEKVVLDMELPMDMLSEALIGQLSLLEPFGKGNTKPLFAERNLTVMQATLCGTQKKMLRMTLKNERGAVRSAICFQNAERLYEEIQSKRQITAAYYPQINEFRGRRSIQLVVTHWF